MADFGDLWDYAARLAPWADAFGDAALSVHPYPAAGADIRAHFLGQLGLPDLSVESEPGEPTNARILRDVLEYQRVLNTLPLPTARKRAFHKPLIALSQAAPRPAALQDAPVASAQRLAEIEAAYADRNDEVARRYRGGEALFPPLLAAPTAAAEAPPYAGLSPEAVATITGWLLLHKDA